MKLDILAFGAHPDDVEACAGGTLCVSVKQGKKVGIIDLTAGENAETGEGDLRVKESHESAKVLGVVTRKNLHLPERNFVTLENENLVIKEVRLYKPDIVMIPYWQDRHKGHRDASVLLERAIQDAKYSKIIPELNAHKVKVVLYYMIHYEFEPNFIFDISETQSQKMKALMCHRSQMFKKDKNAKFTKELIDPDFIDAWVARSQWYGYVAGVKYGEPFAMRRPTGIKNLSVLTNLYR